MGGIDPFYPERCDEVETRTVVPIVASVRVDEARMRAMSTIAVHDLVKRKLVEELAHALAKHDGNLLQVVKEFDIAGQEHAFSIRLNVVTGPLATKVIIP